MADPTSLLGNARAFARDFPRDHLPPGFLWDVLDYVPAIIDSQLTGRGGWIWGSTPLNGDPETGIYAVFSNGERNLTQTTNGRLYEISETAPYTATDRGALARAKQNPIQLYDTVIHFDGSSASVPALITNPGGTITIGAMNAAVPRASIGCTWQDMLILGGVPGSEDTVHFTKPGDLSAAIPPNSVWRFPLAVTSLISLRNVTLVFHAGSVSRLRGSTPPHDDQKGDLDAGTLFDRVGTVDPKSIARWLDNCVFADEHGVHLTDGAVVRNIVNQGSIQYYWRVLWGQKTSCSATVFMDYYILTLILASGPPVTLVCDLNRRQWFRFSNLPALTYYASSGGTNMERAWAGLQGTTRLARLGPCFFPVPGGALVQDDNGVPVLPSLETGWHRLTSEGRKRVRFAYLSYDARVSGAADGYARPDQYHLPQEVPPGLPAAAAGTPLLEIGYITSPQQTSYVIAGTFPATTGYRRYRLPVNKQPYGVAFRVRQTAPSTVTRVFDLAVEAQAAERSRT